MINAKYAGMTAWESLTELLEDPPGGKSAKQMRQYQGTLKVLDAIISMHDGDDMIRGWVIRSNHAILDAHRSRLNASDIIAFRMEFGGPE
jgi:hypothetical protein